MASFAIITDQGVVLDVAPDSKLTVEFVATTFNDETTLAGSFSYPVVFPFTPKNDVVFTNGRYLENRSGRKPFDVNISFFGMSWKRAKLSYDVSSKGYEGVVVVDNSIVADQMRKISIAEVFTVSNNGKFSSYKNIPIGFNEQDVAVNIALSNLHVGRLPYCFPTYINAMQTGTLKVTSSGETDIDNAIINNFDSSVVSILREGMYSPFFYLTYVIKEVCGFLGFIPVGNYLEDDFIKSLIIDNTGCRSGADLLESGLLHPAQHLPVVSIADFFKSLRNDHKVMIYFDSQTRKIHFDKCSQVIASLDRLDITNQQLKNSLLIKRQTISAYNLVTKIDDGDELYQYLPYEKSVKVGTRETAKDIQMSIGRPFMRQHTLKGIENLRCMIKQQIGNLYGDAYKGDEYKPAYNIDREYCKNSFAMRLLSFKGFQLVRQDPEYFIPYATSTHEGNLNTVYDHSLALGGQEGLINQYTLPWYVFYCVSEQVELRAKFDLLSFMAINPLQKLLITDENCAKVECLMDKTTFEPSNSGSSIDAKIVGYTHYNFNAVAGDLKVLISDAEIITPGEKLYAKVWMMNFRTIKPAPGSQSPGNKGDVIVELYLDPACTVPATIPGEINLSFLREDRKIDNGQVVGSETLTAKVLSWKTTVFYDVMVTWGKYREGVFLVSAYYILSDPSEKTFDVSYQFRQSTMGSGPPQYEQY